MSGGSMEYVSYRINEAADRLQMELAQVKLRYDHGIYCGVSDYDRKQNPDVKEFADAKTFTKALIKQLQAAIVCIRNAAIYAHEAEWWTSGDTSAADFYINSKNQTTGNREAKGIV